MTDEAPQPDAAQGGHLTIVMQVTRADGTVEPEVVIADQPLDADQTQEARRWLGS